MTPIHWIFYVVVGAIAGAVNAVAGGGSLILFPVLLSQGLAAITANATMILVVQPGTISSAYGYRKHLRKLPIGYYLLLAPCLAGGFVGATILVKTSNVDFEHIVPYFMAFALLLLLFQSQVHHWIYTNRRVALKKRHHATLLLIVAAAFFTISLYGGYFGAGFGIIALAFLGLTKLTDIQQMNGLKNLAGVCIGISGGGYFIEHGLIDWRILPLFAAGNLFGGYFGATYSSKLHTRTLRIGIVIIGTIITAALFYKFNG